MYLCDILCIFRKASKFNSLNLGYCFFFLKQNEQDPRTLNVKLLLLNFSYFSTECSNEC